MKVWDKPQDGGEKIERNGDLQRYEINIDILK
jgi:hypothetical protein